MQAPAQSSQLEQVARSVAGPARYRLSARMETPPTLKETPFNDLYSKQKNKVDLFWTFFFSFLGEISCMLNYVFCLFSGHHGEQFSSSFFTSIMYFYTLIRSPLSLLFLRLNSPSSHILSSYNRCSLIILAALSWTHSSMSISCTGEPSSGHITEDVFLLMFILLVPQKELISVLLVAIFSSTPVYIHIPWHGTAQFNVSVL